MKISLVSNELQRILCQTRALAIRYYKLTGRPLGVTGEVAECEAARLLNLQLSAVREAGYDATQMKGGKTQKIQIKGRCVLRGAMSISQFKRIAKLVWP